MEKARVLLCGAGGYGENYVKEFLQRDIPDAELVAIADPFIERSPLYGEIKERGIRLYPSPEAFYAQEKAELCIISSPIHTHYPYIMLALQNGSNVLTEKPVCFRLEQLEEMEKKAKESGLFVSVGYQLCFSRDVQALRKDIQKGIYGKCLSAKTIRLMRRGDNYYARNSWAGKLLCAGELVLDSPFSNACAHQCQNMLFLLGKGEYGTAVVEKVEGVRARVRGTIENYDTIGIRITTTEGAQLYYYTSHAIEDTKHGPYTHYEFENGTIDEDEKGFVGRLKDGTVLDYTTLDKGERLQKLYDAVAACRDKEKGVSCTLETAREHTRAVLLAQELPLTDLSSSSVEKTDDKGIRYFTVPGLSDELKAAYREMRIPVLN